MKLFSRIIFAMLLVAFGVNQCAVDPNRPGSIVDQEVALFSGSAGDFLAASKDQRIIVAMTWVSALLKDNDNIEKKGREVANCVEKSVRGLDNYHHLKALDLATVCMVMMGYSGIKK